MVIGKFMVGKEKHDGYGVYMDQPSKIITKRMDAMEYLKTKIDTLETFDL